MAQNVYEGLFIFDSDLYAKGTDEVSSQVANIIEQFGGEMLLSRLWDERKLMYPVKGHRRGTYWLSYFKIDSQKVKELTRQFQLSGSIVRFLFVRIDPRLVEMLVEHARAGHLHVGATPEQEGAEVAEPPLAEENFAATADGSDAVE
ncbi:MAG: 30S ribosomal protein S6 [Planctomycetaceae bacterium]|jgi:small subunit ribosomal protein S6|nr:30S ribosomal protein S6 [Planctomycetaceae bacterium]